MKVALSIAPLRQKVSIQEERPSLQRVNSVGSVSLTRAELEGISNNTSDLIRYAKLLAGAPSPADNTYVDGLPAKVLPPAEMVSQISVNADPFSAEFSDGDQNHIEITTGSLDRKLRFNLGGGSFGLGGNSILAPGLRSSSSWASPSASGPIPHLPFTFSFRGNFGSNWSQQLVQAVGPRAVGLPSTLTKAPTGSTSGSGSVNLSYSKGKSSHGGVSYSQTNVVASNAGVGGLTVLEAGSGTELGSGEVRAFFEETSGHGVWRSGIVFDSSHSHLWANSTAQSVAVPGYFEAGGAPISDTQTTETAWTAKTVFQSNGGNRYWVSGATVSHAGDLETEVPNPEGQIEFDNLVDYLASLGGGVTGTWFFARGKGNLRHRSSAAAAFLQTEIWESQNSVVMGGLRADNQSGAGVGVSPRLSAVTIFHGFVLRGGSGLFMHDWLNSVLVRALIDDGVHLQEFIATGVPLQANANALENAGVPLTSRISRDLVRPRAVMSKASIQRPLGNFVPGLEYTWTDSTHLLGSRRLPFDNGWMDLLESNRCLRKDEIHARVQYHWKGQNFTMNYEWIHSRDDTDGPFSFPEFQDNVRAEWAGSTGAPTHNASLVGSFRLPGALSVTALGSWHSATPFTILTGKDVEWDGLFNDRGGLPRNSGIGPAHRSVSLYGFRHVSFTRLLNERKNGLGVNVGLQADNVLGNRNYLSVGSVLGSPLFGQPLAALPGRSVRLWFNFAK